MFLVFWINYNLIELHSMCPVPPGLTVGCSILMFSSPYFSLLGTCLLAVASPLDSMDSRLLSNKPLKSEILHYMMNFWWRKNTT